LCASTAANSALVSSGSFAVTTKACRPASKDDVVICYTLCTGRSMMQTTTGWYRGDRHKQDVCYMVHRQLLCFTQPPVAPASAGIELEAVHQHPREQKGQVGVRSGQLTPSVNRSIPDSTGSPWLPASARSVRLSSLWVTYAQNIKSMAQQ
jgi:hypothetical protein